MGEIRIVGPGKTRGYPYPVCKKKMIHSWICISLVSSMNANWRIYFYIHCHSSRASSRLRATIIPES